MTRKNKLIEPEDYRFKNDKIFCNIWDGRKLCGKPFDDIIEFYKHVRSDHKDIDI